MKTLLHNSIIALLCIIAFSISATAQPGSDSEEEEVIIKEISKDTTEIIVKDRKIMVIKDSSGTSIALGKVSDDERKESKRKKRKKRNKRTSDVDLFGLDLGLTNYYTNNQIAGVPNSQLELNPWKSVHVGAHFLPTRIGLNKRNTINLKSAITLDYSNFRFANQITLDPRQDSLSITDLSDNDIDKTKLVANYIQVPLLLNFRTNPRKDKNTVSFSVGGYVGALIKGKTKVVDGSEKVKEIDRFNLNPLRYGVTARMDFRWFDFYVNYNLSSLFADNEGPETQTFAVGLNIINF